jgi:hypothetical protein
MTLWGVLDWLGLSREVRALRHVSVACRLLKWHICIPEGGQISYIIIGEEDQVHRLSRLISWRSEVATEET